MDKLIVETALGKIIATPSADPDYPGIFVGFQPNGNEFEIDLALIEASPNKDQNLEKELRVLVWGDKDKDDYTDAFSIVKEGDTFLCE